MRSSFLAIAFLVAPIGALGEPTLEIRQPDSGSTARAGQVVEVTVEATEPGDLDQIVLASRLFGGLGPAQAAAPTVTFSVPIPLGAPRGEYLVAALSRSVSTGALIESTARWTLSVEDDPLTNPQALEVEPASPVVLRHPGSQTALEITAIQADGTRVRIGESSNLSVSVDDPLLVQVTPGRSLVGLARGSTTVRFEYRGIAKELDVEVRGTGVTGDIDGDGDTDSQDLLWVEEWVGRSASNGSDVRDLDGDSRITTQDSTRLIESCTRRRCATSDDLAYGMLPDHSPPTVSITVPTNGARVSGTVGVVATATDDDRVGGVQFLVDGSNFGVEDTLAPYSVAWDSRSLPLGDHVLMASARDDSGNSTTSTPVLVTTVKKAGGKACGAAGSRCSRSSSCCSSSCTNRVCD